MMTTIITLLEYLVLAFVVTGMCAQLFDDGRFSLTTILLVTLLGTVGAWVGNNFLTRSFVTGALLGAGFVVITFLFLFDRLNLFVGQPRTDDGSIVAPDRTKQPLEENQEN